MHLMNKLTFSALSSLVFLVSAMFMILIMVSPAYAVHSPNDPAPHTLAAGAPCNLPESTFLGIPNWYKYLDGEVDGSRTLSSGEPACSPVVNDVDAVFPIGLSILEGLIRFAGVVAVVMVFWSAFEFITSQGNGEKAASARKTAINAGIGLAIVIVSVTLVSFVGGKLGG